MKNQKTNLKKFSFILAGSILLAGSNGFATQPFSFVPGDLVVTTYGLTNSDTLVDGQATPITLQQFSLPTATSLSAAGALVLPTSGTGSNIGIVGEYGSSSEGTLQVSGDGQYLTIGGYDGNLQNNGVSTGYGLNGNPAEAQSTDANVPRVAAVINIATASVDTSTVLNDVYNTNNPRAIYSPDGTTLYLSGQGANKNDEGGLYKTTTGTNTTTGGAAPTSIFNQESTRTITQANFTATGTTSVTPNTFYAADQNSSSKGTLTGIFEYAGSPTSSQSGPGTRLTPASGTIFSGGGFSGSGSPLSVAFSPQAFAFANATTLYVADTGDPKAGGNGDGGIQKWIFTSGSWQLAYTLRASTFISQTSATTASDGETGFEAMALSVVGGNVDIYAVSYTAGDADPNGLYAMVDTLSDTTATQAAGETVVELQAAPGLSDAGGADDNFKGVALLPTPEPNSAMLLLSAGGMMAGLIRRRQRN